MTVDLGAPLAPGSRCSGVITADSSIPAVRTPGGDVQLFRVCPATQQELAWSRVRGVAALLQRWDERHTDLYDLGRTSVDLD
jgi:hypothetical protein